MITWLDLIHVDRRSKTVLAEQIASRFIQLIKDDVLSHNDILPPPGLLAESLTMPQDIIEQAYAMLLSRQYLVRQKQQFHIQATTFNEYALPRPFVRRKKIPNEGLKPLEVRLIASSVIKVPASVILQYPQLDNQSCLAVNKHYFAEDQLVATSQVYYLLFQGEQSRLETDLEARIKPSDDYLRTINIILPSPSQKKLFGSNSPFLLQGDYVFKRGQSQILEIGTVLTTLIYTYQLHSRDQVESFMY
jgi:hypothetical protein